MREEENYERTYRRHIAGHCQPCLQTTGIQDGQWCGGWRFASLLGPGKSHSGTGSGWQRRTRVSTFLGLVQQEVLSAGLYLLREHSLQRLPPLLPEALLREVAILLRIKLLQSWFDLLRRQNLLRVWGYLLQRQMLLESSRDLLRRRVLLGRLSVLRRQVHKGAAVT